jgi:hypothetical protein
VPVFEQLGVRVADHYPLDRDRGEPGRGAGARDGFEVILPQGRRAAGIAGGWRRRGRAGERVCRGVVG